MRRRIVVPLRVREEVVLYGEDTPVLNAVTFLAIRLFYFGATFVALVSLTLSRNGRLLMELEWYEGPRYWYVIAGISLVSAVVGPSVYELYKKYRR